MYKLFQLFFRQQSSESGQRDLKSQLPKNVIILLFPHEPKILKLPDSHFLRRCFSLCQIQALLKIQQKERVSCYKAIKSLKQNFRISYTVLPMNLYFFYSISVYLLLL